MERGIVLLEAGSTFRFLPQLRGRKGETFWRGEGGEGRC